jgi:hypothetical protein
LVKQEIISLDNIDKLFNPSNYLVSPFNSTDRFIKNEYFLTNQQENIKASILTTLGVLEIPCQSDKINQHSNSSIIKLTL